MKKEKNNSGKFKKGMTPWNKGKRIKLDLVKISDEHWNEEKSIIDIAKDLGVSDKLIRLRLKENGYKIRKKENVSNRTKEKTSNTLKRKGIKPKERYSGEPWNKGLDITDKRVRKNIQGLLKNRKYQVLPKKDTKIEVKIQNFLKELGISFFTHQYMKIEHGYQCDILIPYLNLVIECDGDYWHKYPIGRDIDHIRTNELIKKGFKVLRIWEFEIKKMNIDTFKEKIYE